MPSKRRDFLYVSGKKYDGMIGRCYRTTDRSYRNYGARGIRVAGAWIKDINVFRAWLLTQIEKQGLTVEQFVASSGSFHLDRIDVNGHYTPDNCKLSSIQQNARNKRNCNTAFVSAEGTVIDIREEECQVFVLPRSN